MKTVIGISNFSFEFQKFSRFSEIQEQLNKIKNLQCEFSQSGVSLAIANDILKDKYFGQSLETQFKNFAFGGDKIIIGTFKSKLERGYFSGFNRGYTGYELKKLAVLPDEAKHICCTLYAPKVLISGSSSFKTIKDFSSYYEKILGEYPINEDSYFERATTHFTNLVYGDEARSSMDEVDDGFCNYSISFTKCLRALNDFSPTHIVDTRQKVAIINSMTSYRCTPEGSSHKNFKFDISDYLQLDCQYHMKPSEKNTKGDSSFHHKRLYFGFLPMDDRTWKIAIAVIGPHINNGSGGRYDKPKVLRKKK